MSQDSLRDFLELPYEKLEELNLQAKQDRLDRKDPGKVQEERMKYLAATKGIKAVTVCFSDLEGRLHMLDYDKKFLLKSADNLTFDGSSIRGFTAQSESDLRLAIDWPAFYWLPSDVFGPGKVLVFSEVREKDGSAYSADMRARLKDFAEQLYKKDGITANVATEIEGFLFKGRDAERHYYETGGFDYASEGGYYNSLPGDVLRLYIDAAAEVQRAMGFQNEKDHPEVAPSQFEMNFSYAEASIAADQVQLYKLLSRQVAARMDMTASFLPKPVIGVNGSGMHTNMSLSKKGKNMMYDAKGREGLSGFGWEFINRILTSALDLCLVLNSYRRLDPHFEAPNQIKASAVDRGSMVRVPIGNEKSARVEVRSVAPDANPYLTFYSLFNTGINGPLDERKATSKSRYLPDNIYDAISGFEKSKYIAGMLGADEQAKFADLKRMQADRCAKQLGAIIKIPEIQFHHEVTNQFLWSKF
jgi:glutamine synthetase